MGVDWKTKESIPELYLSGKSSVQISRLLGCSKPTVLRCLRQGGVRRRTHVEAHANHDIKHNAFSALNEGSEYFAGFLMGDGCVQKRGPRSWQITLSLAMKDEGHVKKFRDFIGSKNRLIYERPSEHAMVVRANGRPSRIIGSGSVKCTVNSEQIAADLIRLGVTPNKSLTAVAHPDIATSRHFMRGLVDSDGTISIVTQKAKPPAVTDKIYFWLSLVGSRDIVFQFYDFCCSVYPGITAAPKQVGKIWRFSLSMRAARVVIGHLYANATVSLDRKRTLAEAAMLVQDIGMVNRGRRKNYFDFLNLKNKPGSVY